MGLFRDTMVCAQPLRASVLTSAKRGSRFLSLGLVMKTQCNEKGQGHATRLPETSARGRGGGRENKIPAGPGVVTEATGRCLDVKSCST